MTDDEFDALRERVEALEAEAGIDHDDDSADAAGSLPFGDDDPLWVKLTDDMNSIKYSPMSKFDPTGPDAGSQNPYSDRRGESWNHKFLTPSGSVSSRNQWYFEECEVLTRGEVLDEVME